jgi:hypothetical protein
MSAVVSKILHYRYIGCENVVQKRYAHSVIRQLAAGMVDFHADSGMVIRQGYVTKTLTSLVIYLGGSVVGDQ